MIFIFPSCASRDGTATVSPAASTSPCSSIQLCGGSDALAVHPSALGRRVRGHVAGKAGLLALGLLVPAGWWDIRT